MTIALLLRSFTGLGTAVSTIMQPATALARGLATGRATGVRVTKKIRR